MEPLPGLQEWSPLVGEASTKPLSVGVVHWLPASDAMMVVFWCLLG